VTAYAPAREGEHDDFRIAEHMIGRAFRATFCSTIVLGLTFGPVNADDSQAALSQAIAHYSQLPQCPDADIYVDDANKALEDPSAKGFHVTAGWALTKLGDSYKACSLRIADKNSTNPVQALKLICAITLAEALARYGSVLQFAALYTDSQSKDAQDLFVSLAWISTAHN
jgi:hypothetical protein